MSSLSTGPGKAVRPSLSFWIVLVVVALLAIPFAFAGGVGGILILLALFGLVTALYALIFGRRSWIGLPHRKAAIAALGASLALMIGGGAALPNSPETSGAKFASAEETVNSLVPALPTTAVPTTELPSPTAEDPNPRLSTCTTESAVRTYKSDELTCLKAANGKLVWLDEKTADKIAENKAADDAATRKAEADAAEKKSAEAAKKAAQEQLEIQPLIPQPPVQQPAAPPAPAPAPAPAPKPAPAPAPKPAPAPNPGVVHPGSFCSGQGALGVSKTGRAMFCGVAKDGRLRWMGA